MTGALDRLDPSKREKVQVVFITVDPERDTMAVTKDYVDAFECANIVRLTGTWEQLIVAETASRIHARQSARADGDCTMSHVATIDIMDPDGRYVAMAYLERIAERLARLVR